MAGRVVVTGRPATVLHSMQAPVQGSTWALTSSQGADPPPAPKQDCSPRAAMQQAGPQICSPSTLSPLEQTLRRQPVCSRARLAVEWRMLYCSHCGVGRDLTLALQKIFRSLQRC